MNNKTETLASPRGDMLSTQTALDLKSGAAWLACAPVAVQERFLTEIGEGGLCALPYLFDFWAMDHQLPPEGVWRAWVILGGRGAGKTRAGAEWVRAQVEGSKPLDPGRARRVALVGETFDQVRDVMVFGDSGIMACSPPDRRPHWKAGEAKLIWPNGAEAKAYSAHDPEGLRGPQFDAAWVDELAKWRKGQDAWDMLQFALRLGEDPRVCVTTTPRNVEVLSDLLEASSTVVTHAPTEANRANLAQSFLEEVRRRYAGTRLGRQELDGLLLNDIEGALWPSETLGRPWQDEVPDLDRVVVAVDPSVSTGAGSDACGIIVAGVRMRGEPRDWEVWVLADETVKGMTPIGWAETAVAAVEIYGADRLVVEVNQGGQLVEEVVRQVDGVVPIKTVHASRGKVARAEPVAALYEQGRVHHLTGLDALEAQMGQMSIAGFQGKGSPDRVDALVWAVHELMIEPARSHRTPRFRSL